MVLMVEREPGRGNVLWQTLDIGQSQEYWEAVLEEYLLCVEAFSSNGCEELRR